MPRAGITPDQVARVGAELADEIGFDQVTVAEVARRFGVRTPSLYSHVASTEDLRVRVALLALDELADRVADAIGGSSRKEALAGLMNSYRDYAREFPGRFAATLHPLDAETAAHSAGIRHSRYADSVVRAYGLSPEQAVHAVRLVGSAARGFITLELSHSFDHSSPSSAESWANIITALDALMRSWPTEPKD